MYINNRHNGMGVLSYSVRDGHFLFIMSSSNYKFPEVSLSING